MNSTIFFIIKILVSGTVIALVSQIAKAFPKWAALLTALPLVTVLSLVWIYIENKDLELLAHYTKGVLIWILPTLFFLLALVGLFRAKVPFLLTMGLATLFLALIVAIFNRFELLQ